MGTPVNRFCVTLERHTPFAHPPGGVIWVGHGKLESPDDQCAWGRQMSNLMESRRFDVLSWTVRSRCTTPGASIPEARARSTRC